MSLPALFMAGRAPFSAHSLFPPNGTYCWEFGKLSVFSSCLLCLSRRIECTALRNSFFSAGELQRQEDTNIIQEGAERCQSAHMCTSQNCKPYDRVCINCRILLEQQTYDTCSKIYFVYIGHSKQMAVAQLSLSNINSTNLCCQNLSHIQRTIIPM